MKGLKF